MISLKYLILIMFLSKLFTFDFNCNNQPYYGAMSKSSQTITFQSIIANCEQLLPKKSKLDGVLLLTIQTESNQINKWEVIAKTHRYKEEGYQKIAQLKEEEPTIEQTGMPFGYRPFSSIAVELDAAYKIAAKDKGNVVCNHYSLYFPLTPADNQPIWIMNFEDSTTVMIGANTGEIIPPMMY
jgi:hypothetical protein